MQKLLIKIYYQKIADKLEIHEQFYVSTKKTSSGKQILLDETPSKSSKEKEKEYKENKLKEKALAMKDSVFKLEDPIILQKK